MTANRPSAFSPLAPRPSPLASRTPPTNRAALIAALLCATAVVGASGCRVDQTEFNNRVFACNVASPDPGCGTDESGEKMGCFATRQLGATDFCAKTCDPEKAAADEAAAPTASQSTDGMVCLQSGISLAGCLPSMDHPTADPPQHGCVQQGMACYRTDLLEDEGVCTTMNPCDRDTDCHDPIRSVCAATFLASLYAKADAVLQRDHMYCLQTGCRARGTSCSPGETCLQEVIPASANPPDICVPNCDSNLHCPPNYLCYRKVSTAVTPNVCIPGLLGFTCDSSIDCMMGKCIDNDIGYKVCTTPCKTAADCEQFDGVQGRFLCVRNPGDATVRGVCQTPDSYRGSLCDTTADCGRNPDEVCSRFSPKDVQGTCLLPCAANGKCPSRVGINHTCLPSFVGAADSAVCFPGYFGLPCALDSNCLEPLACLPTGLTAPAKICSTACTTSAECGANRWIANDGWCHPQLHICVSKANDGADCASDEGCKSGKCSNNKCAAKGEG